MNRGKKITTTVFALSILACVLHAETLVYRWQMKGHDILTEEMNAETGVKRKLSQKGFLVIETDPGTSSLYGGRLYKYWKEKGSVPLLYSSQPFLNGDARVNRKITERGEIVEISAIGENYWGDVKQGFELKTLGSFRLPLMFKGAGTWKNVFDSGRISTGAAKFSLVLDKAKSIEANIRKQNSDDPANDPLDEETLCSLLFNMKPHEYRNADACRSIYGGSASVETGIFEFLAVGTEELHYAFPTDAGAEGTVLMFDDKGHLQASAIGSRDEYLLNRTNHYGSQSAETISDFREAVEAILGGPFDPTTITNITNQIDIEKLLELIGSFLEEHDDVWISEHIHPTKIIEGMTAADIEALLAKLMKSDNWKVTVNYNDAEIEKLLEALKKQIEADGGATIDRTVTKYLKPSTIIENMSDADTALLSGKLGLPKSNLVATSAPSAHDDSTKGYSSGSRWIDIANEKAYCCVGASTGNAKWLEINKIDAANITGLDDAIDNNGKLKLISVTKPIDLDAFSGIAIGDGDQVNLPSMKAAIGAILDYMHNDMGVAPQIFDKNNL
jgi:hypothetical protein